MRQRGCQHGHQARLIFSGHVNQNDLAGQRNYPVYTRKAAVKLAPRFDLVKPDRAALATASATVAAGVLAVWLILALTDRQQQRVEHFGSAMAAAMAALTVEALIRDDRMHLGVVGNRLADQPEVRGAATLDADQRPLATTGSLPEPHFTEPVVVDGDVIGYVRVAIDPTAFAAAHPGRPLLLLTAALLLPLLITVGASLVRAIGDGTLRPPRWRGEPAEAAQDTDAVDAVPPPEPEPIRHYLLAINLYNQLSLQPTEREFELSLCLELAESVAARYQGQVVALPGVGALLDFDHTNATDRPTQVIHAAFLLARLLREEAPFGVYRLGMNVTHCPVDEVLALDDDAVNDAVLLSALARDLTLAVSAPCMALTDDAEPLTCKPLVNPLLDELTTSAPACWLVTDLGAPATSELLVEVEQLRDQREAIASPSTR
jgi:uncharacterized membrane protein affecting hemolysin expression